MVAGLVLVYEPSCAPCKSGPPNRHTTMAGVNNNITSECDVRADRVHSGQELLLWRTRPAVLGGRLGQGGALCKDGPVISSETVIMRTSRPRLLWAVWKATGETAWTRSFAQASPITAIDDLVFVSGDKRLWCLDASTGHTRWNTPAGDNVVGRPTVSAGQVFWPSSEGLITCADARSGNIVWREKCREGIFPRLSVVEGRVVWIETQPAVVAVHAATGQPAWRRTLRAASPRTPREVFEQVVVPLPERILLMRPQDGSVSAEWSWSGGMTGHVAHGESVLFAVLSEPQGAEVVGQRTIVTPRCRILRLAHDGSVLWEIPSPVYIPRIVWEPHRALLYEACRGLAVIDPREGRRSHLLSMADVEFHLAPALEGDRIYAATFDGEILAFRSPVAVAE